MNKQTLRKRSIKNIIHELSYIQKQFPQVTHIIINDDTFLSDQKRAQAFCKEIIRLQLPFTFSCFGRFDPLHKQTVRLLSCANFINIVFGLESANVNILRKAHKKIILKNVFTIVHLLAKTPINMEVRLIVGLPGENWETIKETGLFIQEIQKIKYLPYLREIIPIAQVFPGTELDQKMRAAGLLTDTVWKTITPAVYYTLEHSLVTLKKMKKELLSYISIDYLFSVKGLYRQLPILMRHKKMKIVTLACRRLLQRFINFIKKTC